MFGGFRRVVGWLRLRWLAWRNARLADPAFQRWATRFRPSRGVARADTRRLFDLCAGFVYSQVLTACIELDLFAVLYKTPLSSDAVAERVHLSPAASERLLRAAHSLALLERLGDGRYALARLGAAALGNPAIKAMVQHHTALYADLADPVARLRDREAPTALRSYWRYADTRPAATDDAPATRRYTDLMADSQVMIADQALAACDLSDQRRLLDIGGGAGVFAEQVARRYPHLSITVLDLPAVAEQASARLAGSDEHERIVCMGADMWATDWAGVGEGVFDTISFVRILHDHDDTPVATLLAKAHDALAPGGRLVIVEPMADTPGGEPVGAAYFGFYLWAMGQGRARSATELSAMVRAAGFVDVQCPDTPNPLLARVLTAYRTAAIDGH